MVSIQELENISKKLEEKNRNIKWLLKQNKKQNSLKKIDLHLCFFDNDADCLDNLPQNTKTITFLNFSLDYNLLQNLPMCIEKIFLLDTHQSNELIKEKLFKIPFGCEIFFLRSNYHNSLFNVDPKKKFLYNYLTEQLKINLNNKLYTIHSFFNNENLIVNVEICKIKNKGIYSIQPTSDEVCLFKKFMLDNINYFKKIHYI